jgi:hypothetical protein
VWNLSCFVSLVCLTSFHACFSIVSEKCDPTVSGVNFCGYFTGQVNVYGREQDQASLETLKIIDSIINPSDPTKLHPELVGMSSADQYLKVTGGNVQLEGGNNQTSSWVALGLAVCFFFVALWWFFLRGDKQGDTGAAGQSSSAGFRWNPFEKHNKTPYDPEEMSIGPSFESSESASFQDGDRMLITDGGRPVYMDYDASSSFDQEESDLDNEII